MLLTIAASFGVSTALSKSEAAVAIAASSGFVLPVGYQTHLMVFGPGGYRVRDFVRMGVPMVVIWFTLSMLLIPWLWF